MFPGSAPVVPRGKGTLGNGCIMFSGGSSKNEGVAGSRNNLKCQWVIGMGSGMAHSKSCIHQEDDPRSPQA